MKTKLVFKFTAGKIDDKSMNLCMISDRTEIFNQETLQESFEIESTIDLPTTISFELSGKNNDDTKIDKFGNITADKFIKLESISVDGIEIESWRIPKECLYLQSTDQRIPGSYWGFNGTAHLVIDKDDPVIWLLSHPSMLNFPLD